jgi:hypothetical protein
MGLIGVFPWSLHIFGPQIYPVDFHRGIMMNGFMLSFVCGFLMTAIPRFTSSDFAKIHEVLGGSPWGDGPYHPIFHFCIYRDYEFSPSGRNSGHCPSHPFCLSAV